MNAEHEESRPRRASEAHNPSQPVGTHADSIEQEFCAESDQYRAERDAARSEIQRLQDELTELRGGRLDAIETELERIANRIETLNRRQYFMPRELLTDMQALHQLMKRYSPEATLPNIGGWALSPTGLLAVTDIVAHSNATSVVECGSGTSTLWIAYALRALGQGRKVTAFDHLIGYAQHTRGLLKLHGLEEYAEVHEAPLNQVETPRGAYPWYTTHLDHLPDEIDVLLVDGPPQSTGAHARYPALPILAPRLSRSAWIVMDDTDRPDEKDILGMWLEEDHRLSIVDRPGPGLTVLKVSA